jgi:hypothetical protein
VQEKKAEEEGCLLRIVTKEEGWVEPDAPMMIPQQQHQQQQQQSSLRQRTISS